MTRRKSYAESVRRLCSTDSCSQHIKEDGKTPIRDVKVEEPEEKPFVCRMEAVSNTRKPLEENPLEQEPMDLGPPPLPNLVEAPPVDQPIDKEQEGDWTFEMIMDSLGKLKNTVADLAKGMIGSGVAVNFSNEFFNPPCPVQIPVAGFNHGQRLRMVVVPTHHSSGRFAVNLKSPHDIVLHFNPRFDERAVVRNSTHHGHWQNEERHCDHFPFTPNHVYTLEFISSHGQVEVLVNGNLFCSFAERAAGHSINQIEIEGDVVVHSAHVTH